MKRVKTNAKSANIPAGVWPYERVGELYQVNVRGNVFEMTAKEFAEITSSVQSKINRT